MNKIFRYELHRVIWNKFYLGMLVLSGFYAYNILQNEVLQGIAHTAPFSAWSFRYYLAALAPVLGLALIYMVRLQYLEEAKKIEVLTDATPMDRQRYYAVKVMAIAAGWGCLFVLLLLGGVLYLYRLFGATVQPLLLCGHALFQQLPILCFLLGICMAAGSIHPVLFYLLTPVSLLINLIPCLPQLQLTGIRYYEEHPLAMGMPDPAYQETTLFVVTRCIYLVAGLLLCLFAFWRNRDKKM